MLKRLTINSLRFYRTLRLCSGYALVRGFKKLNSFKTQLKLGRNSLNVVFIGMVMWLAGTNLYGADSLNCRLIGFYDIEYAHDVYVVDTFAYVADRWDGLRIINVANPSSPVEIGFYDTGGNAYGVYVVDTLAYVADGGLRIINVATPASPVEIGFYDTGGYASGVYVVDTLAYVADGSGGLRIINVATPASLVEIGFYDTGNSAGGVYVVDTFAYVTDYYGGLRIINVANPVLPVEVGFYDTGNYAYGVYVVDTLAYVADGWAGLRIINVANPASPIEVGFYDIGGYACGVYVVDTLAYVAGEYSGLRIINVANPVSPVELGFYETIGPANGIYVVDTLAYVADSVGLYIIEYYGEQGIEERNCFADTRNDRLRVSPNPSFGNAVIKYGLPEKADISLKLYDISGKLVKTFYSGIQAKGEHTIKINNIGSRHTCSLPRGIYFIRFETGKFKATRKLTIIR